MGCLCWRAEFNYLNTYSFTPSLCTQYENYSDGQGKWANTRSFYKTCGEHIYSENFALSNYNNYFGIANFHKWNIIEKNKLVYSLYEPNYLNKYLNSRDGIKHITPHETNIQLLVIPDSLVFIKFFEVFKNKNPIFVDIGTNIGLMALPIAKYGYQVYGFEPVLKNIMCLETSIKANNLTNIKIYPYALHNINKTLPLSIPVSFTDNASLNTSASICNVGPFCKNYDYDINMIECRKFDDIFQEKIDKLRLVIIKVDVQGFELPVLLGMLNFIRNHDNIIFMYEVDKSMTDMCGYNIEDIKSVLINYNFIKVLPENKNFCVLKNFMKGNEIWIKMIPRLLEVNPPVFNKEPIESGGGITNTD